MKDGVPDGFKVSRHRSEDMQNNFSALVIILFADKYSYDMEEGVTHEKI